MGLLCWRPHTEEVSAIRGEIMKSGIAALLLLCLLQTGHSQSSSLQHRQWQDLERDLQNVNTPDELMMLELGKRAPMRFGKRMLSFTKKAPMRFGKRAPMRFGKRDYEEPDMRDAMYEDTV